ncbi:Protein of unknown function [Gryllus bimaculatus]|nr:Protein of unknown function [Gryllus bimaculatus]
MATRALPQVRAAHAAVAGPRHAAVLPRRPRPQAERLPRRRRLRLRKVLGVRRAEGGVQRRGAGPVHHHPGHLHPPRARARRAAAAGDPQHRRGAGAERELPVAERGQHLPARRRHQRGAPVPPLRAAPAGAQRLLPQRGAGAARLQRAEPDRAAAAAAGEPERAQGAAGGRAAARAAQRRLLPRLPAAGGRPGARPGHVAGPAAAARRLFPARAAAAAGLRRPQPAAARHGGRAQGARRLRVQGNFGPHLQNNVLRHRKPYIKIQLYY